MEGPTEGQTDRLYFIGPFRLIPEDQKLNNSNSVKISNLILDYFDLKLSCLCCYYLIKLQNHQKSSRCLFQGLLLTIFFTTFDKIFSQKHFFLLHQILMNPSFIQSITKRNNTFWIYSTDNRPRWQQHLQRKVHNVGKRYNNKYNRHNKT